MQRELLEPGVLLNRQGELAQVGWSRQPVLDCNLENAAFYRVRPLQRLRVKRWDYYGLTTPGHYFSFTLADLGYAGQVFAYVVDFEGRRHHEETLTIPLGRGIVLPRNSTEGESAFDNGRVRIGFGVAPGARRVTVSWPGFEGQRLAAEVTLAMPAAHESMNVVIPIAGKRFYLNRKVNCLPAEGWVEYRGERFEVQPEACLGNLDWGRGVWEYRSFWVWASASGFLRDGRTLGLNLGFGFGDTSAATENAVVIDGRVHKLGEVRFDYDPADFKRPWRMESPDGRLDLEFVPFYDRTAQTNLLVITSEVHQMFGRYHGTVTAEDGETIAIDGLTGFAEEHLARW
ncbi:MAG: DUF2804 domain-containing protein [Anaerolineae bacterium]|nr:DUF2804 domain-containing protein [Anaerolineae bacterium]